MSSLAERAAVGASPTIARPAVTLEHLTKRFAVRRGWREMLRHPSAAQHVNVVQDVSLSVREGEFFGLLGPNGAGKSTLFKMLATLVTPDAGTATVGGFDIRHGAAHVRRVLAPVLADERSLQWRLSAHENLALYAALHGLRGATARGRVDEMLRVVELHDTGNKLVGSFSSGMRQRLLIARALLSRPKVLLLDEPTRSLDPISARAFRQLLRTEIAAGRGCTVLLATHSAEEALELCDRLAVLDRGRLLAVGRPDELIGEHADGRFRLWTTSPEHAALRALRARGRVTELRVGETEPDGWTKVDVVVPDGLEGAANVVSTLARAGVAVARFEQVRPSLADLIERVVARRGGAEGGAA